jgi:hypothetical protein
MLQATSQCGNVRDAQLNLDFLIGTASRHNGQYTAGGPASNRLDKHAGGGYKADAQGSTVLFFDAFV